jgi:hypothetical protein
MVNCDLHALDHTIQVFFCKRGMGFLHTLTGDIPIIPLGFVPNRGSPKIRWLSAIPGYTQLYRLDPVLGQRPKDIK